LWNDAIPSFVDPAVRPVAVRIDAYFHAFGFPQDPSDWLTQATWPARFIGSARQLPRGAWQVTNFRRSRIVMPAIRIAAFRGGLHEQVGAGMDVAAWLRGLGLDAHVAAFASNGIDATLLGDLTNEDLKDLGVVRLADRKRLLNAIADLASRAAPGAASSFSSTPAPGEHRQVTVLFADIVDFTKLTMELGAESIHALLNRFFEAVDSVIGSHGGIVDKHIGDNVMALFGAPVAHDDDPLRAVRAAFEIHRQVSDLCDGRGRRLSVHVGIASGQVVASDTGSDSHREYTVTGASVNLAARLQAQAAAGETLVSDAVQRAVARAVTCEPLGTCQVKGMERPVAVWRVTGGSVVPSPAARAPFVGREAELAQLSAIIDRCRDGRRGAAVVLRGEAGIGKTRLVEELTSLAVDRGFRIQRGLVLDFGAGEGRDAIRSIVQGLLGIAVGSDRAARQAAVDAVISSGRLAAGRRVFLNDLLALSPSPEERAVYDAMTNAARNDGKRTVLAELLRACAAEQHQVIIIEDIHWADPLVLAYLARIAATFADAPGLLVMTSRVDGYPLSQAWRSGTSGCPIITFDLPPLRSDEALRLAGAGSVTLSPKARDCVARAGGNPLFLEQLLRNVEEHGDGEVPGSIQSLVLARLDRLPPIDRQALQAASVLGQRFALDAMRYLIGSPAYDCRTLLERSFIRPEGDSLLFDHALVQDGVSASLLRSRRESLHRLAAEFFAESDLVLHAQHLDRAGDGRAAAAYLAAATAQSTALHYSTALTLARRGLEIAEDPALHCSLACLTGEALRTTGSTEDSISAFEDGLSTAVDPRQRCIALIGIAEGLRISDRHQRTLVVLKEAEIMAREAEMLPELARIHTLRGNVYFPQGRLAECRAENEKALDIARQCGSVEGEALALSGLGDAYYLSGKMRTAGHQFRACLGLCKQHTLRRIEVANRHMIGWTRLHLLEFGEAEHDALASIDLAQDVGHPRAHLLGLQLAGYVNAQLGANERSDAFLNRALDLARSMHADNFTAQILRWRAGNALGQGNRAEAEACAAEALDIVRRVGMTFIGPVVLAVRAALTADEAASQALLKEAEDILDAGCVAHNHFWFAQVAIEHCLATGAWDRVEHYARRLEIFTQSEPLPWSDYLIAKGRALAERGRGTSDDATALEIERLASIAAARHLLPDLTQLKCALAGR
jgi:class 3 adenylate cyclase/tetratricopeptide (TPR) repeat protein